MEEIFEEIPEEIRRPVRRRHTEHIEDSDNEANQIQLEEWRERRTRFPLRQIARSVTEDSVTEDSLEPIPLTRTLAIHPGTTEINIHDNIPPEFYKENKNTIVNENTERNFGGKIRKKTSKRKKNRRKQKTHRRKTYRRKKYRIAPVYLKIPIVAHRKIPK